MPIATRTTVRVPRQAALNTSKIALVSALPHYPLHTARTPTDVRPAAQSNTTGRRSPAS